MAQAAQKGRRGKQADTGGQDELLLAYRTMLLIRRFEERPASSTAWG